MSNHQRQKLFFAIMAGMTVLICCAMFAGFFAYRAYKNPFMRTSVRVEGDYPIKEDKELGFASVVNGISLREHLAANSSYHLYTDHLGARVNAPGIRTPDTVEIMVLGGSFAWGDGVENHQTFAQLVAQDLDASVVNFALGSYSTVQSFQLMQRHMDLKPRIVIYGFIEDHIHRNLSPCAPSLAPFCLPVSYVDFDNAGAPFISPPKLEYSSFELNRRYQKDILDKTEFGFNDILWRMRMDLFSIRESRNISYTDNSESRTKSMSLVLGKMAETARQGEAALIIVYIPVLQPFFEIPPPPKELLAATEEYGITLLDLSDAVYRHYNGMGHSLVINTQYDPHPNPLGHKLIAGELIRLIEQKGILNTSTK